MPNYKNGKIYRIVCNETGEQYIGSTTETLARRLSGHKRSSITPNKKCRSFQIIGRGNYEIVLIEDCPCETKEQLHRRERHFIETMDCVNKKIPLRTNKEYYEANREQSRQYYEANRDIKLEQSRQYYETNRDRKLEYQLQYQRRRFEEDPDAFRRQRRDYYAANKDRLKQERKEYSARLKAEATEATHLHQQSTV